MRDQTKSLTARLDSVDTSLVVLKGDLTRVNNNVNSNTAKIEEHGRMLTAQHEKLAGMEAEVEKLKAGESTGRPVQWPVPTPSAARCDDPGFAKARRSLRIWPIAGSTREEIWGSTGSFIERNLSLSHVTEATIESITRPDVPSGPGVRLEVIVTFFLSSVRDSVMGASSKLASFIDTTGKPTAGIRLEVPPAHRVDFSVLFKYGQMLRTRHGQGLRRHVKFEDVERSLFLNVKLPGDDAWSRVTVDVARRGLRSRNLARDVDVERRMDINGPSAADGRPRAASTSAQPMQTTPPSQQQSTWTGRRNSVAT